MCGFHILKKKYSRKTQAGSEGATVSWPLGAGQVGEDAGWRADSVDGSGILSGQGEKSPFFRLKDSVASVGASVYLCRRSREMKKGGV